MNIAKNIFSNEQKGRLINSNYMRNLYFDRERKNFIKFFLDVKTTCQSIYNSNEEIISNKLKEMHGKEVDLNNYSFLIVELLSNKSENKSSIDLKIGMKDTILFNVLQNNQLMLCYLQTNKHNLSLKKELKNDIQISKTINTVTSETLINNYKYKFGKNTEVYLSKTVIHYYSSNKKSFSKEKIKVTEKEICIFAKEDRSILINDISKVIVFLSDEGDKTETILKKYKIQGEIPKYLIEITTRNGQNLLIGRNTLKHFEALNKAIDFALIKFKNYYADATLNNKLMEVNNYLNHNEKFICESCITINDLIINKERRKILFKNFKEIKLVDIVNNIMEFKSNFNHKKYNEAISKIKNILEIIKEKMTQEELDKYQIIFTPENVGYIEDIYNKIKEKGLEDNNIDTDENKINELNKYININTFDYLYVNIKKEYIEKYYDENDLYNKDINNLKIKQNMALLLGHYYTNIFNINKEEDVQYLGGEDVEEITNKLNEEITNKRLEKFYVLK